MARRKLFRLPWRTARQIGADVEEELAFHIDTRAADLQRLGMAGDAARAQAIQEFGDVEDARRYLTTIDRSTEAATRRSEIMKDFWSDLAYAARKLRKAPAFTATAIVTLALGIGANTAIFSVVNTVLLRPLPYPQSEQLVRLRYQENGHGDAGTPMDLVDYRSQATTFEDFAMMEPSALNLVEPGKTPERLNAVRVGAPWFKLLRTRPLLGRFFQPDEDKVGAPRVAVLSENLWRTRFGADSGVLNRDIQLNGQSYRVIGVAAATDQYPLAAQIFVPRVFTAEDLSNESRGARWLGMLARVKDGTSMETATADMNRITASLNRQFPNQYDKRTATPVSIREWTVGNVQKPLWVVMVAVALVLLIACANVANLLLVRATARESELAVRTALGAGEARLVRQLITEALLLTTIGAIAGVAIAALGMRLLIGLAPTSLPMLAQTRIDGLTLAVTAGLALITG
ncbi:MAG TPA: ABC transporter permease, partial [Gemmatimonadaceae bacterium]